MPSFSELELRFNVDRENDSCYLMDLHIENEKRSTCNSSEVQV